MAERKAYHTDKGVTEMNWSEAIKAMSEGKKVCADHWCSGAHISSTESTSVSKYLWCQFFGFTWELYEEPEISEYEEPEISEYDKLKYGMYAEVLQTISEQFKELSK